MSESRVRFQHTQHSIGSLSSSSRVLGGVLGGGVVLVLLSPLAPLLCASGGGGGSVANPGDESGVGSVLKALHRQPSGTHALPLLLCSPPPPRAPSCAALRCGSLGWLRAAAGGRWCVGVGVLRLSQTRTTNNYHDDGITSSGGVVVNAGNRQILRTGLRRRAIVWSSSSGSCRPVALRALVALAVHCGESQVFQNCSE